MSFRLTGILVLLFVVLLGFLYFYEIRGEIERRRAMEEARKLLQLEHEKVTRLTLKRRDILLVAAKEKETWQILEPVKTAGDRSGLELLIAAARALEVLQVIVDSAEAAGGGVNLADFGLEDAEVLVVIDQGEGTPDTLAFGDDTPMGYAYLRRSGNPEILAVQDWRKARFQKNLLELRDRRVVPMDMDRVRRLEIEREGRIIAASKRGVEWYLERPVEDRGDDGAIQALLNMLQSARVREYAAEEAEDPASYGLHRPWLSVRLYEGEDLTEKRVILGDRFKPERLQRYYGKYTSRAPIFIIDSTQIGFLQKTPSDLRLKEIFSFDRAGIDRVRLVSQDATVDCKRDSGDAWSVAVPPQRTVSAEAVEDFIARVDNLKAGRFVAETLDDAERYGLDRPALQVTLWKGQDVVREVNLGQKGAQVYAKSDGRPQVVEVGSGILGWLTLPLTPVEPGSGSAEGTEE